jgi:hypothetical protein
MSDMMQMISRWSKKPASIDKRTDGQNYLQNLQEGSSAGSLDAFLLPTTLLWDVRKAEVVTRLGQLLPSDTVICCGTEGGQSAGTANT